MAKTASVPLSSTVTNSKSLHVCSGWSSCFHEPTLATKFNKCLHPIWRNTVSDVMFCTKRDSEWLTSGCVAVIPRKRQGAVAQVKSSSWLTCLQGSGNSLLMRLTLYSSAHGQQIPDAVRHRQAWVPEAFSLQHPGAPRGKQSRVNNRQPLLDASEAAGSQGSARRTNPASLRPLPVRRGDVPLFDFQFFFLRTTLYRLNKY